MGYMSDVAILLNDTAVKAMPEKIRMALDKVLPNNKKIEIDDVSWTLYYVECCKWNPMFLEDVSAIEGWLDKLDDGKDELYEFLRIGEDSDDEEHHKNHEYDSDVLTVERFIACNGETL